MPDEVHEGKGSHTESAQFSERPVNGRHVGHLLFEQVQRFAIKRPGNAVYQEAGAVFGYHAHFAPGGDRGHAGLNDLGGGCDSRHNLNQRHERRRVKKVKANEALRVLDARRNGGDAERGSVGGQYAVFAHQVVKAGEDRALGVYVFVDGLNY